VRSLWIRRRYPHYSHSPACPQPSPLGPKDNQTTSDGQTLGFALAKGLVRGLTRYPNPPSRFYSTTQFWMNVGEPVLCLAVDTSHALDPIHMGVVGGG